MESLTIKNLDELKCLKDNVNLIELIICIDKEPFVLGDISFLNTLKSLKIEGLITVITKLPPEIEKLEITHPKYNNKEVLNDLNALETLKKLKTLTIENIATGTKNYRSISGLINLESLCIVNNKNFKNTKNLLKLNKVVNLDLSNCKYMKEIPGVVNMSQLKMLNLYGCERLQNLDSMINLKEIESIELGYCIDLENIDGLANATMLKKLVINLDYTRSGRHTRKLQSIDVLKSCISLEELVLNKCYSVQSFSSIGDLKNLKKLRIFDAFSRTDNEDKNINFLRNIQNLEDLDISFYHRSVKDLTIISHLKNLKKLRLCGWDLLESINGIQECIEMEILDLSSCKSLKTIKEILELKKLNYLQVGGTNLTPDPGKFGKQFSSEMLVKQINEYKEKFKIT